MRLIQCATLVSLLLAIGVAEILAGPQSSDDLSELGKRLSGHESLCADFHQEKTLTVLSRPLVSKGRLIFIAGKGVLWQVTEPFPAKVLIKETEMVRWDDNGRPERISYAQSPLFHALTQVFLSMFTGDISKLQKAFFSTLERSEPGWRLKLVPRDPGLAKIISSIEVDGQKFVETLLVAEARGDQTAIRFEGIDVNTCKPSKAERESFAY